MKSWDDVTRTLKGIADLMSDAPQEPDIARLEEKTRSVPISDEAGNIIGWCGLKPDPHRFERKADSLPVHLL